MPRSPTPVISSASTKSFEGTAQGITRRSARVLNDDAPILTGLPWLGTEFGDDVASSQSKAQRCESMPGVFVLVRQEPWASTHGEVAAAEVVDVAITSDESATCCCPAFSPVASGRPQRLAGAAAPVLPVDPQVFLQGHQRPGTAPGSPQRRKFSSPAPSRGAHARWCRKPPPPASSAETIHRRLSDKSLCRVSSDREQVGQVAMTRKIKSPMVSARIRRSSGMLVAFRDVKAEARSRPGGADLPCAVQAGARVQPKIAASTGGRGDQPSSQPVADRCP